MQTGSHELALVTGATGFVGSHVAECLVASGVRVRCLVRRSSSRKYLPTAAETVIGDLATGEGLASAVEGAGTIYHVAGVTKAASEEAYVAGNLGATRNLLAACEAAPALPHRFVHVSSLAAVGPSPDGTPLDEDAAPHPLTWYGRSKLAAEAAVRSSRLSARAIILRPPVVYGPRDTDVFEVFRAVARGIMLLIGRGESWFSYVHVKDLAEAICAAGRLEEPTAGTYFIANPQPASWTELGRVSARIMGRGVRFVRVPAGAAYAFGWCAEMGAWLRGKPGILSRQKIIEARHRYWTCDPSRSSRDLGFRAAHSLEAGIAETLAWYKEAGWLVF